MIDRPPTLLQMQGVPLTPSPLDRASLVLVDFQVEYRSGGLPLPHIDGTLAEAARVLDVARAHGLPVVHVQHDAGPGAPIFAPGRSSFELMPEVAPRDGEHIVIKGLPNAFARTTLDALLRKSGRPEIILIGAMTHMCISATARAALDLGYRTTIVAKACATRDLPSTRGRRISADAVHDTALAELADSFAIVVDDVDALLATPQMTVA